jgi:hypothetical protein
MVFSGSSPITTTLHLRKRTRSQGPFLRRHYSASTVVRPCPTPARAVACRDVETATLAHDRSPPITRTTFPTCHAHYPGGSSECTWRLLPRSYSFPQMAGGSASALSLSRPAQASLTSRPIGSFQSPTATFVTRLQPLPVTQPSRSSATGSIDNSPGGIFLIDDSRLGAHGQ